MIIRQNFINPANGKESIKDIDVKIEEMRCVINGKPIIDSRIIAFVDGSISSSVSPYDNINALLDAKRTFVPSDCYQTYLAKKIETNLIEVESVIDLHAKVGHPVAIMNNAQGSIVQFFIIEEISDNKIKINKDPSEVFYAGAIVQNLSTRFWTNKEIGAVAKLSRPEPIPFQIKQDNNKLFIEPSLPINPFSITCYDIYVRNKPIKNIELHWVADGADISLEENLICIETYNGGEEASGGDLKPGTYYVTLITKDKPGKINVNESDCKFIEVVKI